MLLLLLTFETRHSSQHNFEIRHTTTRFGF